MRDRSRLGLSLLTGALALSACGAASASHDRGAKPQGPFTVAVQAARFPDAQRLAEHTNMVIAVRNAGARTIPDLAVTVCNVTCAYDAPDGEGVSAQPFAQDLNGSTLESHSRPVWIVERAPGPCRFSCRSGGPGGAMNSDTNTWAVGAVKPGATARFEWALTAVAPGKHVVAWELAAGLNGDTTARLRDGSAPRGSFTVTIARAPARSYIGASGQIVTTR